jgi:hypothetical protein
LLELVEEGGYDLALLGDGLAFVELEGGDVDGGGWRRPAAPGSPEAGGGGESGEIPCGVAAGDFSPVTARAADMIFAGTIWRELRAHQAGMAFGVSSGQGSEFAIPRACQRLRARGPVW